MQMGHKWDESRVAAEEWCSKTHPRGPPGREVGSNPTLRAYNPPTCSFSRWASSEAISWRAASAAAWDNGAAAQGAR